MEYTVPEINDGIAKVQFSDGSWIFIELQSDMTVADFDDLVFHLCPPQLRSGTVPSFLEAGATRTASAKPVENTTFTDPRPQWQQDRQAAYGTWEDQIEYITENGLEAWQTKVAQIKADNPKE